MPDTSTFVSGAKGKMKLEVSTDGGSTYDFITNMTVPSLPDTTTESYDTTNTDITDNYRTFVGGWSEKGEAACTCMYTQVAWSQLKALDPCSIYDWRLTYTDAAQTTTDPKFDFQAHLASGPTLQSPTDGAWTIDFGLKGSGDDTYTVGTTV